MRTDTSQSGLTLTYPNDTAFKGDDIFIKLDGTSNLGTVQCQVFPYQGTTGMTGVVLSYDGSATKTLTMHLGNTLRSFVGADNYTLYVSCTGGSWTKTFAYRKGITLPYRDHGCGRTYSNLFGSQILHFVPRNATLHYWTGGEHRTGSIVAPYDLVVSIDYADREDVTMQWDDADDAAWDSNNLIGLGEILLDWRPYEYLDSNPVFNGDAWRGVADAARIRLWDCHGRGEQCLTRNGVAVVWDNIDGNRVYAVGRVVSDSLTVQNTAYNRTILTEIGKRPSRKIQSHTREISVQFDNIPRDMYLDEVLLSEEVFYTTTGLTDLHDCVPTTMSVVRDADEYQDILINFAL